MIRRREKTLIVAPYVGEFGWELMNWQARVRRLAGRGHYARVIVCASADRRPLYDWSEWGDRLEFCPVDLSEIPGQANDDHRVNGEGEALDPIKLRSQVAELVQRGCERDGLRTTNAQVLMPGFNSKLWPTHKRWQQFSRFGEQSKIRTDIVLVTRTRTHASQRNQSAAWWGELAAALVRAGHRVDFYPSGPQCLDQAIDLLNSSRLAVGASTGGMHLASLCRCPHLVWGSGPAQRWTSFGISNRQRYETIWNPLGTPCIYDECGWQPSVSHVCDQVGKALERIGRSDAAESPWSFNAAWRIRRTFGRLIQTRTNFPGLPWRLRYLVREHLV
jgi:hypothetical protein